MVSGHSGVELPMQLEALLKAEARVSYKRTCNWGT